MPRSAARQTQEEKYAVNAAWRQKNRARIRSNWRAWQQRERRRACVAALIAADVQRRAEVEKLHAVPPA